MTKSLEKRQGKDNYDIKTVLIDEINYLDQINNETKLKNVIDHYDDIYEELKVQSKDHLIHQPPVKKQKINDEQEVS